MPSARAFFRQTELDRTNWPELRDQIIAYEQEGSVSEARSYPGYPTWPLQRLRSRLWPSLDRVLLKRRSRRVLQNAVPSRKQVSRLCFFAHGICDRDCRGPVPSAGGLQAVELYLSFLQSSWIPAGIYHFDRAKHHLSQIAAGADRDTWLTLAPSLNTVHGGALLWVLVGDAARVEQKYGSRGLRFLILEAGHLMQNLCLLSESLGLSTVPLGGFLEPDIARALVLPGTDLVLYVGVCG